jgi:subtilisin family serine protease
MKAVLMIISGLIFILSAHSQDFIYEGPAKSDVRSFWTNAMGIQKTGKFAEGVAILEAKLKGVKEKDPAYKTDKMEAEITKWKNKSGNAADQPKQDFNKLNPSQKAIKADELLRKLFYETNISVSPGTVPVIQFTFKEYNDLLQQYINLNFPAKESDIRRTKLIIEKNVYSTNKDITNIENSRAQNTTPEAAEVNYYIAKYNQLYWEAAVKIFPEETSYSDEYKVITDVVNKNGSLEDMKAGMNRNNTEKIKSRKLPPAVMKDANAEKMMMDVFDNVYGSGVKGKAIKAVILQSEWHPVRNDLTGVLAGRQRQFAIAYKGNNGKCYLVSSVYLYQNYNGSTYNNTIAKYGESGSEMLCENVR